MSTYTFILNDNVITKHSRRRARARAVYIYTRAGAARAASPARLEIFELLAAALRVPLVATRVSKCGGFARAPSDALVRCGCGNRAVCICEQKFKLLLTGARGYPGKFLARTLLWKVRSRVLARHGRRCESWRRAVLRGDRRARPRGLLCEDGWECTGGRSDGTDRR